MARTTVIVLALIVFTGAAHAAVVEYNTEDRDQWFADVGGAGNVSTVDFTGYPDFTPVDDQWAHLGVHFTGLVFTSGKDFSGNPQDGWGLEGYPDINVTFDQPMRWIAVDMPGITKIELYSDDQLFFTSTLFGLGEFVGLISDMPFDRARFFTPDTPVEFIDDLHFGPPIPAPGALGVFGIALFTRRCRRRRR